MSPLPNSENTIYIFQTACTKFKNKIHGVKFLLMTTVNVITIYTVQSQAKNIIELWNQWLMRSAQSYIVHQTVTYTATASYRLFGLLFWSNTTPGRLTGWDLMTLSRQFTLYRVFRIINYHANLHIWHTLCDISASWVFKEFIAVSVRTVFVPQCKEIQWFNCRPTPIEAGRIINIH